MVVLIWENGGLGGWFWGWLVHPRRCLVVSSSPGANCRFLPRIPALRPGTVPSEHSSPRMKPAKYAAADPESQLLSPMSLLMLLIASSALPAAVAIASALRFRAVFCAMVAVI